MGSPFIHDQMFRVVTLRSRLEPGGPFAVGGKDVGSSLALENWGPHSRKAACVCPWPPGSHQRPDEVGGRGGWTTSHPSSRGPESSLRGCVLREQLADPNSLFSPREERRSLFRGTHFFFMGHVFPQPVSKPSNFVWWGQWAWAVQTVRKGF